MDAILFFAEEISGQAQSPESQTSGSDNQEMTHTFKIRKTKHHLYVPGSTQFQSEALPSGPFCSRMRCTAVSAFLTVFIAQRAPLGNMAATLRDMLSGTLIKNWISGTLMYSAYLFTTRNQLTGRLLDSTSLLTQVELHQMGRQWRCPRLWFHNWDRLLHRWIQQLQPLHSQGRKKSPENQLGQCQLLTCHCRYPRSMCWRYCSHWWILIDNKHQHTWPEDIEKIAIS